MSGQQARAFLEHIVTHPDDDPARLVFADWLEEQGQSARAELIRVQIERARLPGWDARQVGLRLRERALLDKHGRKWEEELPAVEGVNWGKFRRGFVAEATFSSFAVLGMNASTCWAAAPLEGVGVRWPRRGEGAEAIAPIPGLRELSITDSLVDFGDADRFADLPLLSTLRTLEVGHCNLGGEGFRRLATSPHLGNLTALRVPGNSIGNRAVSALINSVSLTSLEELDLSEAGSYGRTRRYGRYREDPVIEATDLAALATWPGMARLRSLTLSGNHIRRRGLRSLLRSRHGTALKELRLRANGLNGQAMQEFGAARSGLELDVLDLGENLLGDVGASDLALAPCLGELKVLQLDRCEIQLSGARWLVNAPLLGSLRRLNVNHNSLGPEGLYRLLEKKPSWLHTLQLVDNDLGDEGAAHLAESPASDSLLEVDLAQNGLTDQAAQALAKSKRLKDLLVLRLKDNSISPPAAAVLGRSPLGQRLAVLEVNPG
jgi:uncharacterized protein (TIGR02996 family)